MSKITVVGSFVMDLVATVDEFPLPGQTIIGKKMEKFPGGKGANQCVTIARLNGDVSMIGKVGNDEHGVIFKDLFKKENINIDNVLTCENELTAVGLIQLNNAAENKIVVIPGANYEFTIDELRSLESTICKSEYVLTQLELQHEVTFELIKMCHKNNVPLILNPAPAIKIDESILGLVDTITPNETELEILTGISTNTEENVKLAAQKLLDMGVKRVIATLGSKGAMIADKDGFRVITGYKVDVVDTVAAGDSFNGALVKCLVDGMDVDFAVRYANAVGALTVQGHGAIPSLPTFEQTEKFIKDNN